MSSRHKTPPPGLLAALSTPRLAASCATPRLWPFAAWCACSAAGAQIPDERTLLGDVPSVFAASKYDQSLTEAPADVTIVTRAEELP